jgi:hypothetical protein
MVQNEKQHHTIIVMSETTTNKKHNRSKTNSYTLKWNLKTSDQEANLNTVFYQSFWNDLYKRFQIPPKLLIK